MAVRPDSGYTNLIGLFQKPNDILPSIQPSTLFGAVTHYLRTLPTEYISSFTQTIVSSPSLWADPQQFDSRTQGFSDAFRSAVLLKSKDVDEKLGDNFMRRRKLKGILDSWLGPLCDGFLVAGTDVRIRTPLLVGTLQGLEGISSTVELKATRGRLEDELVIALAEVVEGITTPQSSKNWCLDFAGTAKGGGTYQNFSINLLSQPTLPIDQIPCLLALSQAAPLLPTHKLAILDLDVSHEYKTLNA